MNGLLLVYGAFLALSNLQKLNVTVDEVAWNSFKLEHGKIYANEREEILRRAIFTWNKHNIDAFNAEQSEQQGYKLAVNSRSDWSDLEVRRFFRRKPTRSISELEDESGQKFLQRILDQPQPVPAELDWRKVPNRVSSVKEQKSCNSGWAFAVTGVLEGQELAQNASMKELVELSTQNLVDCAEYDGCDYGEVAETLVYIHKSGGIQDEKSYPYLGHDQICRFDKSKALMKVWGFSMLKSHDEEQLKELVSKFGPVTVNVSLNSRFLAYSSGVFKDRSCSKSADYQAHNLLIVGYGTDQSTLDDYWIVKNSWGSKWGENGYIRIGRNLNICNIIDEPIIPTFK